MSIRKSGRYCPVSSAKQCGSYTQGWPHLSSAAAKVASSRDRMATPLYMVGRARRRVALVKPAPLPQVWAGPRQFALRGAVHYPGSYHEPAGQRACACSWLPRLAPSFDRYPILGEGVAGPVVADGNCAGEPPLHPPTAEWAGLATRSLSVS